ncbi:hypothetical protein MVEG_08327 [Podila verticillata NRRL 6337]|nr:hypothetical protein MVEG_08327 [Podila verticillata NRRL 6337]
MKLTAAAFLALCAPSFVFALVQNDWEFKTAPSDGMNDITFSFNIANATHQSGFYFAQQFNFKNVSEVGYTGLQPRQTRTEPASFTQPSLRFKTAPRVLIATATMGRIAARAHTYNLVVENTNGTIWRGSLVDTVTGNSTVVGEWTLPVGAGKIVNGQFGFVEYYPWNRKGSHPCDSLPWTEAIFYDPTSKTSGTSGGVITSVYETGNCIGKTALNKTKIPGGYDLKVGFHV